MPFALANNPSPSEVSDAINYLLANFGANLSADPDNGQITGPGGVVIAYLYRYLAVKYSDSFDGSSNFSDSPTNRQYYGLRNTDFSTESTNPADYIWRKVTGGFGTTKFLFYKTSGGRQVAFYVGTASPSTGYVQAGVDSIDLDILTATTPLSDSFVAFFQPSNLQVARTGDPLTPSFTGINPALYAINGNSTVDFVTAQTDSDVSFVNNTWRIGGSSTTGNGSISYTNITIGSPTDGGSYAVWPNPTAMAGTPATIAVPVRFKNSLGVVTQAAPAQIQLIFVDQGTDGDQNSTAYLYQWSISTPGNPSGTSTYTWATGASSSYTGGNGWQTTIPTNPGTPLLVLWVASKRVTAAGGTSTSTVDWTSGYSVAGAGQNGDTGPPGSQSARPTVYQWAASIPSISGTSTYTWATGSFSAPSGWSTSITTSPSPGFTLWAASVSLVASGSTTTSTINWSTSSIIASGYASVGTAGASSRLMYARIAGNPSPVSGTVTVSGDNRPTGAQASAVWGGSFNVTWYANDPDPTSNNSLYQADGIYNGSSSTAWSTPYISSLKVGSLSAITVNTGNLTVTGTVQSNTAAISGTTMTGSGGVLYSSGLFAFGNSTTNIAFNGSQMTLNGNVVNTANLATNSTSASYIATGATGTAGGSTTQTISITMTIPADAAGVSVSAGLGRYTDGFTFTPCQGILILSGVGLVTAGYGALIAGYSSPSAGTFTFECSRYKGTASEEFEDVMYLVGVVYKR
jgi:hypothetical protein